MPMKVTVCFDRVRVIVPCGDGEIPVHSLIEKAIVRFKKATGKSSDYWVSVQNLRNTDGGILDPDDLLVDVVDDREQLVADYEEQGANNYQPHNGDGASASSTGTASPEPVEHRPAKTFHEVNEDDTVVVTPKDLSAGSRLTVRRGSEPSLHVLNDNVPAVKAVNGDHNTVLAEPSSDGTGSLPRNGTAGTNPFNRFARDSWRQSLGNRPDMYKWLVAQEKQQDRIQMERKEPVGGASTDVKKDIPDVINRVHQPHIQGSILINLPTVGGPLGIHVVPDYNEEGRENGLLVQGVEPGGRIHKDGRLGENDRIVEINGINLLGINFKRAQEIFRDSMKADEIKLRVIKKKPGSPLKQPPPTLPKPKGYSPTKPSPLTLPPPKLDSPDSLSPTGPEKTSTPAESGPSNVSSPLVPDSNNSKTVIRDPQPIKAGPPIRPGLPNKPQSPTKKVPPAVPTRDPKTALSAQESAIIAPTNTKKIGKKIQIQLKKGPSGLGFSVTTRDNPAGGFTPIYIKNILPKGAAIDEGTLKAGDRLLKVDDQDMDGKSQSEVVAALRNVKLGEMVTLEISRQVTEEDRFKVPRQLNIEKQTVLQPAEKSGDEDGTLAILKNKEVISLDIPLNDTGSAGLGVSVKGKTITIPDQGTRDLGIFIKAVISGGAASRDGRLAINDQLLEVNGENLKDLSNFESMETLRKAMQKEGVIPGHINLKIARKIGAPSPSPFQESSTDYFLYNQNKSSDFSDLNDSKEIVPQIPLDLTRNILSAEMKDYGVDKSRNFLIERLMNGGNGLRNDSYTRATHDSFNDSGNVSSPEVSPIKPLRSAPTVQELLGRNSRNSVLIEDDSLSNEPQPRIRPHSTLGILRHNSTNSSSSEDGNQQPPWLQSQDWDRHHSTTSEELVSPMSPMGDAAMAFSREGFGRQSMSEKRKAHMDPSHSEVYQKIKSLRDSNRAQSGQKRVSSNIVRVGSMESLISHGNRNKLSALPLQNVNQPANVPEQNLPGKSNLKRFGSLENLATTGASSDTEEKRESPEIAQDSPSPELPHMSRGRKCNDSFRAAVDRSYDPPTPHSTMDTLEEESSESNLPSSARSSVSSDQTDENKKSKKKNPKDKKGGILKGIFKIGKSKKTEGNTSITEDDKDSLKEAELQFKVREEAIRFNQREHERAQEQFRRLQESSQPSEQYRLLQHYHGNQRSFDSDQSPPSNMTRAEWIQHLRMEHQRKHRERRGHYPHEDREELHEHEIQQSLEKPQFHGDSAIHSNMYHQVQRPRPGSRQQFDRPEHYQVYPSPYHYEPWEQPRYQRQPAVEIIHQRQSSDTLDNKNSYRDIRHMPSRSHTPIERYFDGELSYHEKPFRHEHSSGYYGDPMFAYRDPVYPSVAGKRPVQTISQSGSAKV